MLILLLLRQKFLQFELNWILPELDGRHLNLGSSILNLQNKLLMWLFRSETLNNLQYNTTVLILLKCPRYNLLKIVGATTDTTDTSQDDVDCWYLLMRWPGRRQANANVMLHKQREELTSWPMTRPDQITWQDGLTGHQNYKHQLDTNLPLTSHWPQTDLREKIHPSFLFKLK